MKEHENKEKHRRTAMQGRNRVDSELNDCKDANLEQTQLVTTALDSEGKCESVYLYIRYVCVYEYVSLSLSV